MRLQHNWDASQMPSQRGKIAIVTGANSGIGYVTALELVRKGAHVVLACRSKEKGRDAVVKIHQELEGSSDQVEVEFRCLDVSSLESVKTFADNFKKSFDRLDLLINNAGIMAVPYFETVDGLESQIATNHLGHFALTAQLFDVLCNASAARVVNVSSLTHRSAFKYDEDHVVRAENEYNPWLVYADSKLANLLFTAELARRLQSNEITNVISVACHPGCTSTNLFHTSQTAGTWFARLVAKLMATFTLYQRVEMGALPSLYAATSPNIASGQFIGPNGFNAMRGYPVVEVPSAASQSVSAGVKLWAVSERLTLAVFPFSK